MFIKQAVKEDNPFYKYLLGIIVISVAFIVGQLPVTLYFKYFITNTTIDPLATENDIMKMMDSNVLLFLLLLSFLAMFLIFPTLIRGLHKMKFIQMITSRQQIDYGRIRFSFVVWASFIVLTTIGAYILFPKDYVVQFDFIKFLILFGIVIILIPIQSVTEEFIFRGYLMQGMGVLFLNKWIPLLFTSILFGVMHGLNPEVEKLGSIMMVFYIGTGLMLGVITLMDEGLELAMGFHIANNLISVLLVTTEWGALRSDSILRDVSEPNVIYSIFLPLFFAYPILLLIFANKYKWVLWKEKLTGTIN